MAPELSSNWKKLQAQLRAQAAPKPAAKPTPTLKRKTPDDTAGITNDLVGPQGPGPMKRRPGRSAAASSPKKPSHSSVKPQGRGHSPSQPSQAKMGTSQSQPENPKTGVSPSIALWAADNDISAEDIAEAYGLGIKNNSMLTSPPPSLPNAGLSKDLEVGKYIGIDCEMVGVGENGYESALARVSIVDFHGQQIYDSFVRPEAFVTDWRTHVSGVGPKNMATARTFDEVRTLVAELIRGRILVGHDIKHDLQALQLDHSSALIRDTAKFSGFRKYGHGPKPALRVLAREILGVEIQKGQHSSIEDARVAMLLFRQHKSAFDVEHAKRFPDTTSRNQKPKKGKQNKRRH